MKNCYDCVHLRCVMNLKDGVIEFRSGHIWCRKGMFSDREGLTRIFKFATLSNKAEDGSDYRHKAWDMADECALFEGDD